MRVHGRANHQGQGHPGGALAKICPCIAEAEGVEQEIPALFAFLKVSLLLK
jgi:hypothetical protein